MSMTRTNRIICDDCGQFVSYDDIANGIATHTISTPDSDLTRETWETECANCRIKNNSEKIE